MKYVLCLIYCNAHAQQTAQQNNLSVMADSLHDLFDFKANWREFCDHSYFRDLTSNQRQLRN